MKTMTFKLDEFNIPNMTIILVLVNFYVPQILHGNQRNLDIVTKAIHSDMLGIKN